MANHDLSNSNNKERNFPYKTLIWAVLALAAMFLFRGPLQGLISRADEVAIFGIQLKVNKEQAAKLETAINTYKDKIEASNNRITDLQNQISDLKELKDQLEEDMTNCPEARQNAALLDAKFTKLLKANTELKQSTEILNNTKVFQRMNFKNN